MSVVGASMTNVGQDVGLSFDDIMAAVKETARGRWFIESFETRLRNGNLSSVMEAIARLEERVEHFSRDFAEGNEDAHLVKKARAAIAAARRDITLLENKPAGLSNEAQLFARLAAQAKDTFGQKGQERPGITRALNLVEELDREFSSQTRKAPAAATPAEPADLFQPDEAIFEAAPPMPAAAAAVEPARETPARGAKVVFHKPSGVIHNDPLAEAGLAEPEPVAEAPVHQRIVVRRRGPSEGAGVPLLEEAPAA